MHMRQAIVTKYIGPTDRRGSRIKASAAAGSITVDYDDRIDVQENCATAARLFAEKMGWCGRWEGGGTKTGYVFVNVTDESGFTFKCGPKCIHRVVRK